MKAVLIELMLIAAAMLIGIILGYCLVLLEEQLRDH